MKPRLKFDIQARTTGDVGLVVATSSAENISSSPRSCVLTGNHPGIDRYDLLSRSATSSIEFARSDKAY